MITLIYEVTPKNNMAELKEWLKNNLPTTKNFEGCISLKLYGDKDDENTMRLIIEWRSAEDIRKYQEFRTEEGGGTPLVFSVANILSLTWNLSENYEDF